MKKLNRTGAILACSALATLGLGGVWAHAASGSHNFTDSGDTIKPVNGISLGSSPLSTFTTVGGAITIKCTHNNAAVKTPGTAAAGNAVALAILPPTFDNGVTITPGATYGNTAPCPVTLAGGGSGGTAVTVTSGAWNATAYDCPIANLTISNTSGTSAGGTCSGTAEAAAEPNADVIVIHIPQNGAVVHTGPSLVCTINVAPAVTGWNVRATYNDAKFVSPNETLGTLVVNILSGPNALPISVTGTGCPTAATTSTFVATYTFAPKLLDT